MPEQFDIPDHAGYRVGDASHPHLDPPREPQAPGPAAIIVAHGMGQQIHFETMEAVAEGLLKHDEAGTHHAATQQIARTVLLGGERLQRLELNLLLPGGNTREVHVYEAYWAPFTEGQVKLRDVTGFLFRSALAGIQLGQRDYRRWMFGQYARFPAPARAVLYLLVALSVILALTFLNGAVAVVIVARAPLQSPPAWLNDALVQDITTVLNGLLCALAPLMLLLTWATWSATRKSDAPQLAGVASLFSFVVALWSTLTAAVLVAAAFMYRVRPGADGTSSVLGPRIASLAQTFDRGFDAVATGVLVFLAFLVMTRFLLAMFKALTMAMRQNAATRALTLRVLAGFLLLFGLIVIVAAIVWSRRLQGGAAAWRHGVAWPLIVAVSLAVRSLLIQFVGDVAAYIQPQRLDRFCSLREQIKTAVGRVADAVYGEPQYRNIILVGHSLGSVVIYDVLNRLILDRQLAGDKAPEVVQRTKLLLTFGSPLDKTAFIFGTQGTGREPREALAASVQPLITDQTCRPKWINIWSPWDIISGHLDYYDLPDKSNRHAVENLQDERAVTLLLAHVQYWSNPLLFRQILAHLV